MIISQISIAEIQPRPQEKPQPGAIGRFTVELPGLGPSPGEAQHWFRPNHGPLGNQLLARALVGRVPLNLERDVGPKRLAAVRKATSRQTRHLETGVAVPVLRNCRRKRSRRCARRIGEEGSSSRAGLF